MSSPIFFSTVKNPSLTAPNLVKGFTISLKSITSSITKPWISINSFRIFVSVVFYSLILQVCTSTLPNWVISTLCQRYMGIQHIENITSSFIAKFLCWTNLPLVLGLYFTRREKIQLELQTIYMNRLRHIDTSNLRFFKMVEELPLKYDGWHYQAVRNIEVIQTRLILNHVMNLFYVGTLLGIAWISQEYPVMVHLIHFMVSIHIVRQYYRKISNISISLMLAMFFVFKVFTLEKQADYYLKFEIIETAIHSTLFPYFNKLGLNKDSKDQWCESRFGIILGWAVPLVVMLEVFPLWGAVNLVLINILCADLVWNTSEYSIVPDFTGTSNIDGTDDESPVMSLNSDLWLKSAKSSRESSPHIRTNNSDSRLDGKWVIREVYYNGVFTNDPRLSTSRTSSPNSLSKTTLRANSAIVNLAQLN